MDGINTKLDIDLLFHKLARYKRYDWSSTYQCHNYTNGEINLLSAQVNCCSLNLELNF